MKKDEFYLGEDIINAFRLYCEDGHRTLSEDPEKGGELIEMIADSVSFLASKVLSRSISDNDIREIVAATAIALIMVPSINEMENMQ